MSYRTLGAVYYSLSLVGTMGAAVSLKQGDGSLFCCFGCLGCLLFGVGEWCFHKATKEEKE